MFKNVLKQSAVKPSAVLRTWVGTASGSPTAVHSLNLNVEFSTTLAGVDASKQRTLSTTFSNVAPTDSDDYEFTLSIDNFFGFDLIT